MKDTRFLKLSSSWALATDGLQWIIQRLRFPRWRSLSFIAQYKVVLERDLRRHGAEVDSDARRALDHLPATFRQWKDEQAAALGENWVRKLGQSFDDSLPASDKARNGKSVRQEMI